MAEKLAIEPKQIQTFFDALTELQRNRRGR